MFRFPKVTSKNSKIEELPRLTLAISNIHRGYL